MPDERPPDAPTPSPADGPPAGAAPGEFTHLLARCAAGEPQAQSMLWDRVYAELRAVAQNQLAHQRPGHILQATALVNQAYFKLVNAAGVLRQIPATSRTAFFGCAARAMRQVLADEARRHHEPDRSVGHRVPLEEADRAVRQPPDEGELALALERLERSHPELAELLGLRHYTGLSREELAQMLDITIHDYDRRLQEAKARLSAFLARSR